LAWIRFLLVFLCVTLNAETPLGLVFSTIQPYLIPSQHPVKKTLDALFAQGRPTQDAESLEEAGFEILYRQPRSFIWVVRHPSLPGYLVKLVPDKDLRNKRGHEEWWWFAQRCKGMAKIRKVLEKKHCHLFKAPHKWIYPLPKRDHSLYPQRHVILMVEDMQLAAHDTNISAWKTLITPEHLDQLYTIIKKAGGSSYRAVNVPLSIDGKFAFIDSEYPNQKSNFQSIKKYLSPEMLSYWEQITH